MRSKYLMRLLAVAASAAAVLGGGSFALAAASQRLGAHIVKNVQTKLKPAKG